MVGVVVHLRPNLAQRQVHAADVVHHEDVALHYLQLHVVLRGGALHPQEHCIGSGGYEAHGYVVLLGVGLCVFREGVLYHALVVTKLIGNRFWGDKNKDFKSKVNTSCIQS